MAAGAEYLFSFYRTRVEQLDLLQHIDNLAAD